MVPDEITSVKLQFQNVDFASHLKLETVIFGPWVKQRDSCGRSRVGVQMQWIGHRFIFYIGSKSSLKNEVVDIGEELKKDELENSTVHFHFLRRKRRRRNLIQDKRVKGWEWKWWERRVIRTKYAPPLNPLVWWTFIYSHTVLPIRSSLNKMGARLPKIPEH